MQSCFLSCCLTWMRDGGRNQSPGLKQFQWFSPWVFNWRSGSLFLPSNRFHCGRPGTQFWLQDLDFIPSIPSSRKHLSPHCLESCLESGDGWPQQLFPSCLFQHIFSFYYTKTRHCSLSPGFLSFCECGLWCVNEYLYKLVCLWGRDYWRVSLAAI